jgi:thioredoxin 1
MSDFVKEVGDGDFASDVLQAGQPVLVDFWAEWCAPCRMLSPTVDAIAEEYAGKVTVRKMNVDFNPATPAKYGVRGIPTLIVFKDGEEAERIVGAVGKGAIANALNKHIG